MNKSKKQNEKQKNPRIIFTATYLPFFSIFYNVGQMILMWTEILKKNRLIFWLFVTHDDKF